MAWDLSYITKQVEEQAVEHVKAIAADIAEGIRATTPIDTSRLISNNNFSTIAPDYNFEENKFLGRDGAYRQMMVEVNQIKTLQDVFITNETPYAHDIEIGNSKFAPYGVYRNVLPNVAMKWGY